MNLEEWPKDFRIAWDRAGNFYIPYDRNRRILKMPQVVIRWGFVQRLAARVLGRWAERDGYEITLRLLKPQSIQK